MGNRLIILVMALFVSASVLSQPQACIPDGFQKKLTGVADDRGTDVAVTPFNEYLIAGYTNSETGINENYDALLIKLNQSGNIIWQKRIGGSKYDDITKLLVLRNGNYIAMGTTKSFQNPNGNFFAILLDSAGNILNHRELNMMAASHIGTIDVTSIIELDNGDLAFCGNANGINTDVGQPLNAIFNIVGLMDQNLELKWFERLRLYYAESGYPIKGMVATKNSLITIISNGVVRFSLKDGLQFGMQKHFQFLDAFNTIERNGDKVIIFSENHRIILDTNINLISAYRIGNYFSNYKENMLRKTDENGKLIWSYLFPHPYPNLRVIANRQLTNDNGVVAVGSFYEDENNPALPHDVFLYRTDPDGKISECPRSAYINVEIPVIPEIWELYMRRYPLTTVRWPAPLSVTTLNFSIVDICNSNCQAFELSGSDTLCNLKDTLTLSITKNKNCIAMTDWEYDTAFIRVIKMNDTTLGFVGKKQGSFKIRARASTGCQVLQDSLVINIFSSPPTVNLGPDVELCMVKSYKLNAGKGFKSYLWNDGSSDSTLTVTAAGKYFVTATDYCGKQYRDTVTVIESPNVKLNIPSDLRKCNADTLAIIASFDYTNYRWTPNYNIFGTNSNAVYLFPFIDTTYYVTAEKGNGCIVMDTIRITVSNSPQVNLGKDSSFCSGDSLTLNAGIGFADYKWNTGASTQSISVKESGKYSVIATHSNGCISRDEIIVPFVYPIPIVNLGPDTTYCKNERFELIAPSGNAKYEWSNNLISSIIQINSPGMYWVKVTSKDGCIGRDTINLNVKECLKGVFFPNAFTPGNRSNNTFKPIVHGNLISFHLVIYNRYGQKLFETRDPKIGWDGTINGKPQASSSFVWTAQYKFTGDNEKTETVKGSLVLIR